VNLMLWRELRVVGRVAGGYPTRCAPGNARRTSACESLREGSEVIE